MEDHSEFPERIRQKNTLPDESPTRHSRTIMISTQGPLIGQRKLPLVSSLERLLFIDTETSGLSGGTGTFAF